MNILIPCPEPSEAMLRQIVLEFVLAQGNRLDFKGHLELAGERQSFSQFGEALQLLVQRAALSACCFEIGTSRLRFGLAQDGVLMSLAHGPELLCCGVSAKRALVQKLVAHYIYENGTCSRCHDDGFRAGGSVPAVPVPGAASGVAN